MCGENARVPRGATTCNGSSPRVRGKRIRVSEKKLAMGLIPACAGKTSPNRAGMSQPWAHPRVCGENWANAGKTVPFEGSSPRVRGKRRRVDWGLGCRGLIPACAGKTP